MIDLSVLVNLYTIKVYFIHSKREYLFLFTFNNNIALITECGRFDSELWSIAPDARLKSALNHEPPKTAKCPISWGRSVYLHAPGCGYTSLSERSHSTLNYLTPHQFVGKLNNELST